MKQEATFLLGGCFEDSLLQNTIYYFSDKISSLQTITGGRFTFSVPFSLLSNYQTTWLPEDDLKIMIWFLFLQLFNEFLYWLFTIVPNWWLHNFCRKVFRQMINCKTLLSSRIHIFYKWHKQLSYCNNPMLLSSFFVSPNDCKTDIITRVKIIHFEKCWYEQKPSVWDDRWKWW